MSLVDVFIPRSFVTRWQPVLFGVSVYDPVLVERWDYWCDFSAHVLVEFKSLSIASG
jgi:hypothetical protein